jgi:hypothetical protein
VRDFLYICGMEKRKKYKTGGYLYCIKPVVMKNGPHQGKAVTKRGKNYRISMIVDEKFYILDETNRSHSFCFKDYEEWFIHTKKIIKGLNKIVDEIIDNDVFWE